MKQGSGKDKDDKGNAGGTLSGDAGMSQLEQGSKRVEDDQFEMLKQSTRSQPSTGANGTQGSGAQLDTQQPQPRRKK